MKIFHLGSIEDYYRHERNPDAYHTMLNTHGDNRLFVVVFDNADRCSACTHLFGQIKSCVSNINMDHQLGKISLAEKSHRYRTVWIPLTERYISEWGLHMVPLDIRRAIADVRSLSWHINCAVAYHPLSRRQCGSGCHCPRQC